MLAGFSYGQQKERGADVTGEVSFAAALRYDPAEIGASRPFAETGIAASPWEATTYSRTYMNGAGVGEGRGSTNDQSYSIYGRGGWVARLSPRDEFAVSADIAEIWQLVGAYSEATAKDNPFDAVVPAGVDKTSVYGGSMQMTHLFGRRIEADLNLGVSRTFDERSGLEAAVAPVGPIAAPSGNFTYYEAGGRIGYRIRRGCTVDAFVNAELARRVLGDQAHGGLGLRVDF